MPDEQIPLDLGDEALVKQRNKAVRLVHREHEEVIAALMARPEGRRWVYSILERCHIYHTPYNDNPTAMAFRVGEQNVGQQLLADVVRAAPKLYTLMLEEKSGE